VPPATQPLQHPLKKGVAKGQAKLQRQRGGSKKKGVSRHNLTCKRFWLTGAGIEKNRSGKPGKSHEIGEWRGFRGALPF